MSQSRMRKTASNADGGRRGRGSVVKASGDTVACTGRPNQETQRSRSKNKIPKSVRYDLENALVSLCDVWFEDIKPHLVRNNIKLHVHGGSAGGDHEQPPNVTPPVPPIRLDTECSHLDPGAAPDHRRRQAASYVGCCSTPPTASRVRCARLPASAHRQLLSPLPSLHPTPRECSQNKSQQCEEEYKKRTRPRRKKPRSHPKPQLSWRVPRLCQTYSILQYPTATGSRKKRIASGQPPHPQRDDYYRYIVQRCNKNQSTQTEALSWAGRSVGCQWGAPAPGLQRRRTALSPPQPRTQYRPQRAEHKPSKELPLFQDDLINIIGERNDKRLKLLYSNHEKEDYPSIMNLVPLPTKPCCRKKSLPWK